MKSLVLAIVMTLAMGYLLTACAADFHGGFGHRDHGVYHMKHGSCGKGARCAFSR